MKISNIPPKGTADWFPAEFRKRKYIFDTWRKVCESFGYKEYLTPVFEYSELYKAKSGEDVGGKELTVFKDRGDREMAIRPEMTPSVTRLVSRIYNNEPKPIRLFSIANFVRNEKPQKGRNREFWQLNVDMFGASGINADIEMLAMSISLMEAFGAKENDFVVLINHRELIKSIVKELLGVPEAKLSNAIRILDKFWKIPNDEFISRLKAECEADIADVDQVLGFLNQDDAKMKEVMSKFVQSDEPGTKYLSELSEKMDQFDLEKMGKFDPTLVRGFDYYDGFVFEIVDRNLLAQRSGVEQVSVVDRSLFGGGRYNGLAGIFGIESFPAVGFAPGDETMKIFLEEKGLMPNFVERYGIYVPLLRHVDKSYVFKIAQKFRKKGAIVLEGNEEQKISKAIEYANRENFEYLVIAGEDEYSAGEFKVKNLNSGEEKKFSTSLEEYML